MTEPLTLTEKEMAQRLGMSVNALACARNRNPRSVPPHFRMGGRICYLSDRLASWLNEKQQESLKYTCI